jgi:hypothetical protein
MQVLAILYVAPVCVGVLSDVPIGISQKEGRARVCGVM